MADAFGLDDYSYLTGTQQDTARTIQKAFDASTAGRNRTLQRFNLGTEGPMLTEYANDAALRRAQTTAGILNNNQQLQKMIDESHRTPHGLAENLSAYLPALGGLARLYPMLFGTNTGLTQNGILGSAYKGLQSGYNSLVSHWYTDPTNGNRIGLDANGNIVVPAQGPGGMDYGIDYENSMNYTNPAFAGDFNWGNYDYGFDSSLPSDLNWVGADWGF